ncbi:putative holin-like toxin [Lactococcus garvieae]|uniref:putative holin-like toxin n=1 Tax=Lactococcus garvieae TaxID=1363 RepID=UPI003D7569DC
MNLLTVSLKEYRTAIKHTYIFKIDNWNVNSKLERQKFLSVSDSLTLMIAFASFIVMLLKLIIVIVKSIKK